MEEQPNVIFLHLPRSSSRSVSPLSPSPCRERNLGFFHTLSRRFGRRSHEDLSSHGEEDSRSSSTDSCSSTSAGRTTVRTDLSSINNSSKKEHTSNLELSCSASDTSSSSSSDSTETGKTIRGNLITHRRSTSSIRRALQRLSFSSRSLSCSSTQLNDSTNKQIKKNKSKTPPPKRILRQPISYTYLKGMSGLPTQRVPRSAVCCHYGHR